MSLLKQSLWFYSHPNHSSIGGTLRCLIWHLPQVFICYLLSINYIPLILKILYDDRLCLFLTRVRQVGEGPCLAVGVPYHLPPPLQQFHISSISQSELSSLTSLNVCGEKQKVHNDIAFLLVLAKGEATGGQRYGLSTIWVNPSQARVCSMEEAVRELTTWVSSGPNWPYALVWLNEDTYHAPLPKEGHLGVLPQGGADMTAYGRISQLEVCQVLVSGLQVAYPVGLNGHEDPIITSLPESLANGISLT